MLISNDDIRSSTSIKFNPTDKNYQVVVKNDTGSYFRATFETFEAAELFVNEWSKQHG
jgi:hypothetical protein